MNKYRKSILIILLSCSIFLPGASAFGGSSEVYEWKDGNGNLVFSDIPKAGVNAKVKKVRNDHGERPHTKEEKTKPGSDNQVKTRQNKDIQVVMYMTDWCPYCKKAKEYLKTAGVQVTEFDIEKDKVKKEEMLGKSGGSKLVPLIDVEGIIIRGYAPDDIKEAIEKRKRL
jgi:glutaredoxin